MILCETLKKIHRADDGDPLCSKMPFKKEPERWMGRGDGKIKGHAGENV